ncbi:hypothetical protein HKD37_11G031790 [Glycine soja]
MDYVESAHWSLKRLLQISVGEICSIKASFETSMHVVGHVFKVTLYKKLFGMVSRYALNEIAAEFKRVAYAGKNPSRCGCVMRSTHGLPCACQLFKYLVSSIPLETIHIFWRRLSFFDQGLSETQATITEEMEIISKRFEKLDVCGKIHLKSKLPRMLQKKCLSNIQSQQNAIRLIRSMLMPYTLCKIDSIENIIDVKADGNYGYRAIAALLGMSEELWSLVRNHLHKELSNWSEEYMNLVGGIERFEELKRYLLVDELSKVTMNKWMNITDMGYVIASRYNVIVALDKRFSSFPSLLRSHPSLDSSVHRVICIGHVYENHFVQTKQWPTSYIARMHHYTSLSRLNTKFVDLGEP